MEGEAQKIKPTPSNLSSSNPPRSPAGRGPRTPRTPRRAELQPTRLEALDGGQGPLGPLGEESLAPDTGPTPPLKEQNLPTRTNQQPRGRAPNAGAGAGAGVETGAGAAARPDTFGADAPQNLRRGPPPVRPPPSVLENRRQAQPSVSVEQAAKPSFSITVGDPHKVGDLTSSHIVYQVGTKVKLLIPPSSVLSYRHYYPDLA